MNSRGDEAGLVVAERFVIEARLGNSSRSAGFRARDCQTGKAVALSVIAPDRVESPEAMEWLMEVRRLSAVQHGAVAACFGYGRTAEGGLYLATEWPEGEDLRQRMARRPLSTAESLQLARVLGEGLAELDRHDVVHGNIEPRNVMLRGGTVAGAVLMGFGLLRGSFGWKTVTSGEEIVEALHYVAPEQARGDEVLGPESDVFALGCVLFECLTGKTPFAGEHAAALLSHILHGETLALSSLRPDLPAALGELLERMLARDRAARFPGGMAVLEALGTIAVPAASEGLAPPAAEPALLMTEKRLVSIVLGRPAPEDEGAAARVAEVAAADVVKRLHPYQGQFERLPDGSLLLWVWQAEATATDQAVQAVEAALELAKRLPGWSFAVTVGRMVLPGGQLVGEELGQAVARLRAGTADATLAAPEPSPWLDAITAGLVDTRYLVRKVVGGWTVEGRRSSREEARTLLGQSTPCVGREQELALLETLLEGCIEDSAARVMLVLAPSGTGKSRLRQEFILRLGRRAEPVEVLLGAGDPRRSVVPYGLLGQAVQGICGVREGDPLEENQRRIAGRVGRSLGALGAAEHEEVVAFLGELCSVPFSDEKSPWLRAARQDPRLMSDRLTDALVTWLRSECAAHPVLLVLEDLHWSDGATVRVLDAVLAELEEQPLLVLALARPEVKQLFPELWLARRVQELGLGRLGRRASEQLVRQVLGTRVSEEILERIVLQAQGNALFLEELIRAAAEGTVDGLPGTLAAMLQARFMRLDDGARRALRAASIFGETFWHGGVAALLGQKATLSNPSNPAPSSTVTASLETLMQAEIIVRRHRRESRFEGEEEFGFRHALVRDAAYELLTEEDLRVGHRRAGQYLECMGERNALVLAEHYERAGERERAAAFFARAAEQALDGCDASGALRCVERGMACGAEGEVRGLLRATEAWAHLLSWQFPAAYAAGQEGAALLSPGSAGWYRAVSPVLATAGFMGQREVVENQTRACLEAPLTPKVERAFLEAASSISVGVSVQGLRGLSERLQARVKALTTRLGAEEVRAQGLGWFAALYAALFLEGDTWQYLTFCTKGMACFAAVGDQRYRAMMQSHRSFALMLLGDYEQAEVEFQASTADLRRLKEAALLGAAQARYAVSLAEHGTPASLGASQALAEQLIARSPSQSLWSGFQHAALAGAFLGQGELAAAEKAAREAAAVMKIVSPPGRPLAQALLGRSLLGQGRVLEAQAAAEEGLAVLADLGGRCFMDVKLLLVTAETFEAAGERASARRWLEEAHAHLERRAALISDAILRERFLGQVKDHARVRELHRTW